MVNEDRSHWIDMTPSWWTVAAKTKAGVRAILCVISRYTGKNVPENAHLAFHGQCSSYAHSETGFFAVPERGAHVDVEAYKTAMLAWLESMKADVLDAVRVADDAAEEVLHQAEQMFIRQGRELLDVERADFSRFIGAVREKALNPAMRNG